MTGRPEGKGRPRGPAPAPSDRLWRGLFRLALRAHPVEWRERYGREAVEAFEAALARRRAVPEGSPHRYAARAAHDAVVAGWRERRAAGADRPAGETALEAAAVDLRHAARRLRRAPGFAATVVAILALGVGANAAVFTVLRSAVLAPLPFPAADRLVLPRWTTTAPPAPDTIFGQWSYPKFAEFREGSRDVFDGLVAYASRSAAVTHPGDAESVLFEFVTPGYFDLLGVAPVLGRFFGPEEEGAAAPPGVIVLSHAFWMQRFGGDPSVVGRTVTADGSRLEVVGVAPAGFQGLTGSARLWIPLGQAREAYGSWALESRGSHWFHALGRLRPGATPAAAEERVASLAGRIDAVDSRLVEGERIGVDLAPLGAVWSNRNARTSVWLATAAAFLLLGITVSNVAALLLARGRREARETAVRLALGAGKRRLVRARLAEGLLLAVAGGGLGLGLAVVAVRALRSAIPSELFRGAGGDLHLVRSGALAIDPGVALFGFAVAVGAGAVFAIAPTLLQRTVDLVPALRGAGREAVGTRDGGRWLVGGQVALSVLLLVGAGLLVGTLQRLHDEQRGFDPEGLLVLRYSLGGPDGRWAAPGAAREFHRTLRDRTRALPGVRSAALGTTPPLSGHFIMTHVSAVVGREPYPEGRRPRIGIHYVDGDFFETAGTRLRQGRTFDAAELESAERIAVISAEAARVLFPDGDALGREVEVPLSLDEARDPFTVVGVVEDVLYSAPVEGMMPEMYVPLGMWTPPVMSLLVRTDGDPTAVLTEARGILRSLDPDVPFWQVRTGDELRRAGVADTRLMAGVLAAFAALAVVLSMAGLWSVVARAVATRRREIGLRAALGARARQLESLVLRQGMPPIVGGGAVGLALAALLTPRLGPLLFGVGPRDPIVFVGAAGLLVGVALVATWLPARRAARVDPMETLGSE